MQKFLVGEVIRANKTPKTLKVVVRGRKKHLKYMKHINFKKVYTVHDENQKAKEGDVIAFFETRKISKTKYHCLAKVMQTGKQK